MHNRSCNLCKCFFSQDPEFYEFTRSIKAYTETFQSKSDVMLIDSDSDFFQYLNKSLGDTNNNAPKHPCSWTAMG